MARKTYSHDFKLEALRRWQESGQSTTDIEKELGISRGLLYKWRQQLGDEIDQPDSSSDLAAEATTSDAPEIEPPTIMPSDTQPDLETTQTEDVAAEVAAVGENAELKKLEESQPAQSSMEPQSGEVPQKEPAPAITVPEPEPMPVLSEETAGLAEPETATKEASRGKSLVRRIAGVIGIVLGTIGLLLSIISIVGVWLVNKPITEGTLQFLVRIETGLTVADQGLDQANIILESVRTGLGEAAETIPAEELLRIIEDAQVIIESAQATANTASTVVSLANSVPFVGGGGTPTSSSTPTLDEASATIDEISAGLAAIQNALTNRQEGSGILAQVDAEVAQLQGLIGEADRGVEDAGRVVIQLQHDLPGWIDTISIVLTFLLLWLGAAQLSLLAHGWEWLRS